MTERLIKRFLLEKAYNSGNKISNFGELEYEEIMYKKFINGEIIIDESEFELWLENLKRDKRRFGTYLEANGYLTENSKLLEVTDEKDLSSIKNTHLNSEKIIIPSQMGNGCYGILSKSPIEGHMVINGLYDNQLIYLSRLLSNPNNSFTIGYYGRSDLDYTKHVIEYYKQLKSFLPLLVEKSHVEIVEEEVFNSDKIYILSYTANPDFRKTSPIKMRHSER